MSQKYAEIANLFEKGEKHTIHTHLPTQLTNTHTDMKNRVFVHLSQKLNGKICL